MNKMKYCISRFLNRRRFVIWIKHEGEQLTLCSPYNDHLQVSCKMADKEESFPHAFDYIRICMTFYYAIYNPTLRKGWKFRKKNVVVFINLTRWMCLRALMKNMAIPVVSVTLPGRFNRAGPICNLLSQGQEKNFEDSIYQEKK